LVAFAGGVRFVFFFGFTSSATAGVVSSSTVGSDETIGGNVSGGGRGTKRSGVFAWGESGGTCG
jgi:hypothetical protein